MFTYLCLVLHIHTVCTLILYSKHMKVGDGKRGLACCSPWSRKESDTTERLNWTELKVGPWEDRGSGQAGSRGCKRPAWNREGGAPGGAVVTETATSDQLQLPASPTASGRQDGGAQKKACGAGV